MYQLLVLCRKEPCGQKKHAEDVNIEEQSHLNECVAACNSVNSCIFTIKKYGLVSCRQSTNREEANRDTIIDKITDKIFDTIIDANTMRESACIWAIRKY